MEKNVVNWIISFAIFGVMLGIANLGVLVFGALLAMVFQAPGFIFLLHLSMGLTSIVVMVIGLAFPITAAVKADHGILWKYPFSYQFFK